jgi:cysteine synthase
MAVYEDNSLSIGGTPLVRLKGLVPEGVKVYAKIEGRNPAYSVKCRIGAAMIWDAEQRGALRPGMTIVEPTSGNTGIALCFVAAARGYKVILTMPETMSVERRKLMVVFGAKLVLTEGTKGMKGAIAKAEELASSDPKNYWMPRQFDNPANPDIHARTTGPEIYNDLNGQIDAIVAGVGTGGTISGISRYLKEDKNLPIKSFAVEPAESPVISQTLAGEELKPGPHPIQGIGAGFIPHNLDLELIDGALKVTGPEAMIMAKRLAKEQGILCGISSGAAVAAAAKLASNPEWRGKTIVVILPDSGERYLSTALYQDLFAENP